MGGGSRRVWFPVQGHSGAFHHAPALAVVAAPAGSHQILPAMFTTQAAGNHVVQGQVVAAITAILAGVIVPPEDLLLVQLDVGAGAFDNAV